MTGFLAIALSVLVLDIMIRKNDSIALSLYNKFKTDKETKSKRRVS